MSIDVWAQVVLFTYIGTGCELLGHVVLWVELPVQRRLCPIFVNDVGLPDIHDHSAG